MPRPFRQQIDGSILDRAAALFARRGFAKTSVQDVADAVGLSKAGLLHHFPSKDALHTAVLAHADTLGQQVLAQVGDLPPGDGRDRRAVEVLVDVALTHPGLVALLLAPAIASGGDCADTGADTGTGADWPMQAFAVDSDEVEPERLVRVVGALSALAVLSLAAGQHDQITAWRPLVVATCCDALGHRRPGARVPDPAQVEA